MGIDCKIYLPEDVRVADVANVVGVLLGCKVGTRSAGGASWTEIEGVSVRGYEEIPTMASIVIKAPRGPVSFNYHFEAPRGRLMQPRSTALNLAVGERLVQFFGGELVSRDDIQDPVIVKHDRPRPANNPDDGGPWDEFQAEILALAPLTASDLKRWEAAAAY